MIKNLFLKKREKIVLFSLILFLITLPISYGLNSVSAIFIGVLFITDSPKNIRLKFTALIKNKMFLCFLGYFFIQLIGLLYSENIKKGIKEIIQLIPFITLPLTLLSENFDKGKVLKIVSYFRYYLLALLVVLLIYQYINYNSILTFEHDTFLKLKISTFYFSAFIFLAIITSLLQLKKENFKGVINYSFILFFSFVLLMLSARISILILIFCLVLFLFNELKKVSIVKKIILTCILSFSILFVAYQVPQVKRKIDITTRTTDFDFKAILTKNQISNTRNSLEYRVIINYCSINILKNNIFGVGIGDNLDKLLEEYKNISFRAGIKEEFNCHNQYMEEFTKQGVLGGFIFIFCMVFIVKKGSKHKEWLFYIALYVSLVCLVESYFDRQHGVMFTAFFIPIFYNLERINEN